MPSNTTSSQLFCGPQAIEPLVRQVLLGLVAGERATAGSPLGAPGRRWAYRTSKVGDTNLEDLEEEKKDTTLPEAIMEVELGPPEDSFPLRRGEHSASMFVGGRVRRCKE